MSPEAMLDTCANQTGLHYSYPLQNVAQLAAFRGAAFHSCAHVGSREESIIQTESSFCPLANPHADAVGQRRNAYKSKRNDCDNSTAIVFGVEKGRRVAACHMRRVLQQRI